VFEGADGWLDRDNINVFDTGDESGRYRTGVKSCVP
jgi:hypothetical protein